ncbi:hypothetical protein [Kutzneria sp. 744]|uniref:hypothetical protein n=1 Tax=Kutzneria sp. (strain 744) TaxID=345341 RepID=UPI0003EEC7D3|nr:secreted protein [Kutzneria sp. 744]
MSWIADMSPSRKRATILGVAAALGVAVVLGGGFAVISGTSHAATENCQGLDQALQNNLNFIAQQKANPTAVSAANIANRNAVVAQIQQRRQAAGCTNNVTASSDAKKKKGSGEACAGLQKALQNNLNFIADQKAHPDAQSAARIANRQAVVAQIESRLKAAACGDNGGNNGCPTATDTNTPPATTTDNNGGMGMGGNGMGNGMGTDTNTPPATTTDNNGGMGMGGDNGMGNGGMGTDTTAPPATTTDNNGGMGMGGDNGMGNAGGMGDGGMGTDTTAPTTTDNNGGCDNGGTDTAAPTDTATADPTDTNAGNGNGSAAGTAANQVCKGSTVTTSGSKGVSASSNQFPLGTMLKVTNLDNNKSITVPVTSTSGSCVLLDNDAFLKIHQDGKQLIRKALIQKVG